MNNTAIYGLMMLIAGLGIPIMATLNGGLRTRLGSPALAAAILFSVGLVVIIIYLLSTEGVPTGVHLSSTPWYFYLGGLFVALYILSITWVAPLFGVSNAISFVLLGQLIAMSVIDHYALLGATQYTLTHQRIIGLVLMVAGVFMVLSKTPDKF